MRIPYISPRSGEKLKPLHDELISGIGERFPIISGIPRFVSPDNYASGFGLQWKSFAETQLDSRNGTNISRERLERCLGFPVSQLNEKSVLEVGCGAGRFTELLVEGGGYVHSVDLSNAVEVNRENIGPKEKYCVAQADVYALPFPKASFDIVLCLGVIQHTPSSVRTIETLWDMVKPGGLLVFDHYEWRIGYYSTLTPLFRAVLKRMKPERSKRIVDGLVDFFFPLHWSLRKALALNWLLHRVSPLIVYLKQYPEKPKRFHYELSRLDTYDQLTDYYKHLVTPGKINEILSDFPNAEDIWISRGGNGVEARCKKGMKA